MNEMNDDYCTSTTGSMFTGFSGPVPSPCQPGSQQHELPKQWQSDRYNIDSGFNSNLQSIRDGEFSGASSTSRLHNEMVFGSGPPSVYGSAPPTPMEAFSTHGNSNYYDPNAGVSGADGQQQQRFNYPIAGGDVQQVVLPDSSNGVVGAAATAGNGDMSNEALFPQAIGDALMSECGDMNMFLGQAMFPGGEPQAMDESDYGNGLDAAELSGPRGSFHHQQAVMAGYGPSVSQAMSYDQMYQHEPMSPYNGMAASNYYQQPPSQQQSQATGTPSKHGDVGPGAPEYCTLTSPKPPQQHQWPNQQQQQRQPFYAHQQMHVGPGQFPAGQLQQPMGGPYEPQMVFPPVSGPPPTSYHQMRSAQPNVSMGQRMPLFAAQQMFPPHTNVPPASQPLPAQTHRRPQMGLQPRGPMGFHPRMVGPEHMQAQMNFGPRPSNPGGFGPQGFAVGMRQPSYPVGQQAMYGAASFGPGARPPVPSDPLLAGICLPSGMDGNDGVNWINAIENLTKLLRDQDELVQNQAKLLLAKLAKSSKDNVNYRQCMASSLAFIDALLDAIKQCRSNQDLHESFLPCLYRITCTQDGIANLLGDDLREKCIARMVEMLNSPDDKVVQVTLVSLHNLVLKGPTRINEWLRKWHVVKKMVNIMVTFQSKPRESGDTTTNARVRFLEVLVDCLHKLSRNHAESKNEIYECRGVPALIGILKRAEEMRSASKAEKDFWHLMYNTCRIINGLSTEKRFKEAIINEGGVEVLTGHFKGVDKPDIVAESLMTLRNISDVLIDHPIAQNVEPGSSLNGLIFSLLSILRAPYECLPPNHAKDMILYTIGILSNLTCNAECRKSQVSAMQIPANQMMTTSVSQPLPPVKNGFEIILDTVNQFGSMWIRERALECGSGYASSTSSGIGSTAATSTEPRTKIDIKTCADIVEASISTVNHLLFRKERPEEARRLRESIVHDKNWLQCFVRLLVPNQSDPMMAAPAPDRFWSLTKAVLTFVNYVVEIPACPGRLYRELHVVSSLKTIADTIQSDIEAVARQQSDEIAARLAYDGTIRAVNLQNIIIKILYQMGLNDQTIRALLRSELPSYMVRKIDKLENSNSATHIA